MQDFADGASPMRRHVVQKSSKSVGQDLDRDSGKEWSSMDSEGRLLDRQQSARLGSGEVLNLAPLLETPVAGILQRPDRSKLQYTTQS